MSETRPVHFAPGATVGDRYTVEGLVRLCEGRMFYLVHDDRPDQPLRRCWSCGHDANPRAARSCSRCGEALRTRRFLMSARWDADRFDPWLAFASRRLEHPGLASPVDVLRLGEQVLSFVPYQGEGLMLDEAAPLSNQRILGLAQRVVGVLAWLAGQGVLVGPIQRSNLLIAPDGTMRLFDLDVVDLSAGALPPAALTPLLRSLATLLRSYCHVRATPLVDFLDLAAAGDYPTPRELGRAIETRFDAYASLAFPPTMGAMSDVGLTRQLNEDSWGWTALDKRAELFVVADGMGGHDGGEVASRLAVDTLLRVARERADALGRGLDAIERTLKEAFVTANNVVKAEAERKGSDMGTTLVGLLLHGGRQAFVANVGDSRCYLFREGQLRQITTDHSYVQRLVESGRITAAAAREHPKANILLRTVGTERDIDVDVFPVDLQPGDRLLLCSDGLWGEADDAAITKVLSTATDPRLAARELVRAANQPAGREKGGGKDNITVIVVAIR